MGMDVTREFLGVNGVTLYRCNDTGLLFFWPTSSYGGAEFYRALERHARDYYPVDKWEFQQALIDLKNTPTLLEVGCGNGAFLDAAVSVVTECQGLELNVAAAETARLKGHGVYSDTLQAFARGHHKAFDAVCAFQVLEHVSNPMEFLRLLLSTLRPGGLLLIGIPNADGCLRLDPQHLLDMPPHHMTRWTKKAVYALERVLRLRILRLECEPLARRHVRWYLRVLTAQVPGLAGRVLYIGALATLWPALYFSRRLRERIVGHALYFCAECLD